jgi:hypothetical protein
MTKYAGASVIIDSTNNVVNGKGGANITAADAKTVSYYTNTLSWDSTVWIDSGSSYPILRNVSVPTFYTWAQIP